MTEPTQAEPKSEATQTPPGGGGRILGRQKRRTPPGKGKARKPKRAKGEPPVGVTSRAGGGQGADGAAIKARSELAGTGWGETADEAVKLARMAQIESLIARRATILSIEVWMAKAWGVSPRYVRTLHLALRERWAKEATPEGRDEKRARMRTSLEAVAHAAMIDPDGLPRRDPDLRAAAKALDTLAHLDDLFERKIGDVDRVGISALFAKVAELTAKPPAE